MSLWKNRSVPPQFIASFAAGTLLGVGVLLLFAPQSGKKTRNMLARKAHDLESSAESVLERGLHLAHEVKHKAGEVLEKGKNVAHIT